MSLATRIPVTVVAGARSAGKTYLIDQLRAACPADQRWAFLSNSLEQRPGDGPQRAVPADQYFRVAGGCACCIAGPAFRTTLVRLLRAGPWHHLHIEVDAAGHPHTLVDQLRSPPFEQHLTVTQCLLVMRQADSVLYRSGTDGPGAVDYSLAAVRLGFATDFLLRAEEQADPVAIFAAQLESAPPWPRLERVAGRRLARVDSGLAGDLPGWRVFSALRAEETPENFDLLRQWSPEMVAQRRPLKDLLTALASDSSVTGYQALVRTPRDWYSWRYGRGRGVGPLAFNAGPKVVETETSWRFDNRVSVWLRPGTRRQAIELRLQGLDLALQGPDGLLDPAIS